MNETQLVAPPPEGGALAQVEGQRAIAEVQAAVLMAKQYPRDERTALDRILNACTRPRLAANALYQFARGGTDVTGPSIRLAEAMAQHWGNLQSGVRVVSQGPKSSTVEAYCWDLETNTREVKVFDVPHERHKRGGVVVRLTDQRDIYEHVANLGARRKRACILAVIPGDIAEEAVVQCETTLKAEADTSPEAQKKILGAFKEFKVTKAQLETRLQRRLDAITPAQVIHLRKILLSLKDGMSQAADWFEETKSANPKTIVPPKKTVATDDLPAELI